MSSYEKEDGSSRLLSLPRELSDEILNLALDSRDQFFTIQSGRYCGLPASLKHPIAVQILRVNRQLHREGKAVLQKLYQHRPFVFRISARSAIEFLKSLPADDRDAISSICLPEECYTCDDWGNREAWDVKASAGRLNMYNIFDGTLLKLTSVSFFFARFTMCIGAYHNAVYQDELARAIEEGSLMTVNFVCSITDTMSNVSFACGMWKLTNGTCRPTQFKATTTDIAASLSAQNFDQPAPAIEGLRCLGTGELRQLLRSKWSSRTHPIDSSPIRIFTVERSLEY